MEAVRTLNRRLTLVFLAALSVAVVLVVAAQPAEAGACHTAAQTISKRKGVTCKRAKRVANRAQRAGKSIPECSGDAIARWHGWKFKAVGGRAIVIRVSKGSRRFILSGGGAC